MDALYPQLGRQDDGTYVYAGLTEDIVESLIKELYQRLHKPTLADGAILKAQKIIATLPEMAYPVPYTNAVNLLIQGRYILVLPKKIPISTLAMKISPEEGAAHFGRALNDRAAILILTGACMSASPKDRRKSAKLALGEAQKAAYFQYIDDPDCRISDGVTYYEPTDYCVKEFLEPYYDRHQ